LKFIKHLPNFLTICNALLGSFALFVLFVDSLGFYGDNRYLFVISLVFFAAIFDYLDGFFAKILNIKSKIGSQLDSFSDLISFAIVPTFLLIDFISENQYPPYLKLLPLLIIICSIFRLSKFNVLESSIHFKGLPTPANALFFLGLPSFIFSLSELILTSIIIIFSFLLISNFKFYSFKSFKNKDEKQFLLVMILIEFPLIILSFVKSVEFTSLLSYMVLVYVISCFVISGINKQASSN
jgi:CDP-diacylglycerol--serine O-phosphatidyltransferase